MGGDLGDDIPSFGADGRAVESVVKISPLGSNVLFGYYELILGSLMAEKKLSYCSIMPPIYLSTCELTEL